MPNMLVPKKLSEQMSVRNHVGLGAHFFLWGVSYVRVQVWVCFWGESQGCLIKGCLNSTEIPKVGIPKPGIPKSGIPKPEIPKSAIPKIGILKTGIPKVGKPTM